MARNARSYDESDVRIRPGKGSRPRTKDRPDILDPENQFSYSWNDLGADPRHGISVMDDREALAENLGMENP